MKNILILLAFIFTVVMGSTTRAHAFFLDGSAEFSHLDRSPYPYVLSPPVDILPGGFVTINVGYDTYYYSGGVFYQKIMRDQKYVVVPPPIGAVVFAIPEGYQLMLMDGASYYVYEGIYYKRVLEGYKVIFPPV